MSIEGYKVFDKGLINSYGVKFEEKQSYQVDTSLRSIKYGNQGYGFHFVKRLEDGLRYFDGLNQEIDIAKVIALGEVKEFYDDYYGYYDLYVTDCLYIDHILSRNEIMDYIIKQPFPRIERFIQRYRLTEEEIDIIIEKNAILRISQAIDYYQYGNKDAYTKCKK